MKSKFIFPSLLAVLLAHAIAIDGATGVRPTFNNVWSLDDFYKNEVFLNELPPAEETLVRTNFGGNSKGYYPEPEEPKTKGYYPEVEPFQLGRQVAVAAQVTLAPVTINSVRTRRPTKYPIGTNCRNPPVTLSPADNVN